PSEGWPWVILSFKLKSTGAPLCPSPRGRRPSPLEPFRPLGRGGRLPCPGKGRGFHPVLLRPPEKGDADHREEDSHAGQLHNNTSPLLIFQGTDAPNSRRV